MTGVRHALSKEVLESLTSSLSSPMASERHSRKVRTEGSDRFSLQMLTSNGLDERQQPNNASIDLQIPEDSSLESTVLRDGDVSAVNATRVLEQKEKPNEEADSGNQGKDRASHHSDPVVLSEFPKAHFTKANKEQTGESTSESKHGLPALNWFAFDISDRRLLMDCLSDKCTVPNLFNLQGDGRPKDVLQQSSPSDAFRPSGVTPLFRHGPRTDWPMDITEEQSGWTITNTCAEDMINFNVRSSLSPGFAGWRVDSTTIPGLQTFRTPQTGRLSLPPVPTDGLLLRHDAEGRSQQYSSMRYVPVAKSSPSLFPMRSATFTDELNGKPRQRRSSNLSLSGDVRLPRHMLDSSFSADSDLGDQSSPGHSSTELAMAADVYLIEKGLERLRDEADPTHDAFSAILATATVPVNPAWNATEPLPAKATDEANEPKAAESFNLDDVSSIKAPFMNADRPTEFQRSDRTHAYRRGMRWSSVEAVPITSGSARHDRGGRDLEGRQSDVGINAHFQPGRLRARSELRGSSGRQEHVDWLAASINDSWQHCRTTVPHFQPDPYDISGTYITKHPLLGGSESQSIAGLSTRCQYDWHSRKMVNTFHHIDHQEGCADSVRLSAGDITNSQTHPRNRYLGASSGIPSSIYNGIPVPAYPPCCHPGASQRQRTDDIVPFGSRKEDLAGRVLSLAKFQSGSRFLQRFLSRGNPLNATFILNEVHDKIAELMIDPYGNYLCQQLFEVCTTEQRSSILKTLANKAVSIARDRRGTHSMQALISLMNAPEEAMLLMQELHDDVLQLAIHPHGTHVLQRALTCFSEPATGLIFEPVIENLDEIARNPHGLCVVKKCITAAARQNSKYTPSLSTRLAASAIGLIQSPYGNYAIQHALDVWGPVTCRPILIQVKANLVTLSTQKFSSNVVEKTLEVGTNEDIREILKQLGDPNVMSQLINSSYGNFVVQKALEKATDKELEMLSWALSHNVAVLQSRRLKVKWEKIIDTIIQRLGTAYAPGISMHEGETLVDLPSPADFHIAEYHTPVPHSMESASSPLSPETLPSRAAHSSYSGSLHSFTKSKSGHGRQGGQHGKRGRLPSKPNSTTTHHRALSDSAEGRRRQYQLHRGSIVPSQPQEQPQRQADSRLQGPEPTRQNVSRGQQVPRVPYAVLQRPQAERRQEASTVAQAPNEESSDTFVGPAIASASPRRGRRGGRQRRHRAALH